MGCGGGRGAAVGRADIQPLVLTARAAVADQQPVKKKKGRFAGEGGVATTCGSPFAPVNGKARVDHLDHRAVRQ